MPRNNALATHKHTHQPASGVRQPTRPEEGAEMVRGKDACKQHCHAQGASWQEGLLGSGEGPGGLALGEEGGLVAQSPYAMAVGWVLVL